MKALNKNKRLQAISTRALAGKYPMIRKDFGTGDNWAVIDVAAIMELSDGSITPSIIGIFPSKHTAGIMVEKSGPFYKGFAILWALIRVFHNGEEISRHNSGGLTLCIEPDRSSITASHAFLTSGQGNKYVFCELGHPGSSYGMPTEKRWVIVKTDRPVGYIKSVKVRSRKEAFCLTATIDIILTDSSWADSIRSGKMDFLLRAVAKDDPSMGTYITQLITYDLVLNSSPRGQQQHRGEAP